MKILIAAALTLSIATLSAPASAQVAITQSGGIIGETVSFGVQGPSNRFFLLFPSKILTSIPVGCGVTLDVGLDLINILQVGQTNGSGIATVTVNLPLQPGLLGVPGHTQVTTILLTGPCFFDEKSNRVTTVFADHGLSVGTFGNNVAARQGHTLSMQPDGNAVVMGGDEPDGFGGLTALDTIEIYDTDTQEFSLGPVTLTHPRSVHTATTLADGRILLLGGDDATDTVRNTGEIYDPVSGTITPITPMSSPRTQHTATLLADGRVFVAGGSSLFDLNDLLGSLAQATKSTEIYDPVSDTWTNGPNLPISDDGVIGHSASLLPNGQVLITGGVVVAVLFGLPIPSFSADVHRYDPSGNLYAITPSISVARVYHGQMTLPDGRVLIAGGADGDFIAMTFSALANCDIYDPNTNTWTAAAPLAHPRAYPNLFDTGTQVAIVSGISAVDIAMGSGTPEQIVELAPYAATGWTDSGTTLLPRQVARVVPIENGARLLIVGTGDNGVPAVDHTAEMFVP